jgi:hypothetical protein
MTPEMIEDAREQLEREGIEPATDPVLLRRVALLLAVARERRKGGGRGGA